MRSVRLLLVAVLALGLAACSAAAARETSDAPTQSVRPAPTVAPTPGVVGHNRSLAVAELAKLRGSFPLPPRAVRSPTAPTRRMRHLTAYMEPVDGTLVRPRWWIVRMPYLEVVHWYVDHTPANIATTIAPGSPTPVAESELYWRAGQATDAYSSPWEVVAYAKLGPARTALRTDVTLGYRFDRTAETFVPATVTSIDVTSVSIEASDGGLRTTATLTDPASIGNVVAAFNGLLGSFEHQAPGPCASPGAPLGDKVPPEYALTFRWPGHEMAVGTGAPLCGVGRPLTRDGTKLPQSLEDSDAFNQTIAGALPPSD